MMTATTDTSELHRMMEGLHDALLGAGLDASNVVKDTGRQLNKEITNFIPPIKSTWGTAKTSGEMAIQSELYSLISEAEPQLIDEIGSKYGVHGIDAWRTGKGGQKEELKWENLDPTGARLDEYHKRYQNSRGKINKNRHEQSGVWRSRVVVPFGVRLPFVKKLQARVGRAKASMALAGSRIGGKFPSWITRHFGGVDEIAISNLQGLENRVKPSMEFGSRAPGVDRLQSRVNAACKSRAEKMARRIKLILSGYAKDVAAGYRAKPKAKEHQESEVVVE